MPPNISQASQGIREVNENVNRSSVVSDEIARDIRDVNVDAKDISANSSQVNMSASELRNARKINSSFTYVPRTCKGGVSRHGS